MGLVIGKKGKIMASEALLVLWMDEVIFSEGNTSREWNVLVTSGRIL